MKNNYQKDFASLNGKIWLNAASEGPLPLAAGEALQEAMEWKSHPFKLDGEKFISVPRDLKESLGRLLGVESRDVILGNSASYGLHILANGIPWAKGDEILLMQNDFPANILPWLGLQRLGVKVIEIPPENRVLSAQEFLKNITPQTKLFCVSHVHTFTGFKLDVEEFAKICQEHKIIFVVNISQSAGTMPLNTLQMGADAVVCAGYKWLCGPYGTGFCWIRPALRENLILNQAYWISLLSAQELKEEGPLELKELKTARKFDVFGTANFFNFVPLKAALDYWHKIGLENVSSYHNFLMDQVIQGLKETKYQLISPEKGQARSSLIVFSHPQKEKNEEIFKGLLDRGIYAALWKGNIRISPHVYNTNEEIILFLSVLKKMA